MVVWIIFGVVIAFAVFICFLLAIANNAGGRFMEKYDEMNNIEYSGTISPVQFINLIHSKYLKRKLEIVKISNIAGDAYSKGKLFLSCNTLNMNTLASYTIISHELGHALQDEEGNKLKKLNFLRKLGKTIGLLMLPNLIAGTILLFFGQSLFIVGLVLIGLAVMIFLFAIIIKLAMISIEKDASKKAIIFLGEILNEKELKLCKKFLNDARLTYWAELLKILLFWTGISKKGKLFN